MANIVLKKIIKDIYDETKSYRKTGKSYGATDE